jgi:hypothetical protein
MQIPETQKLVLGKPLIVFTLHHLGGILSSKGGLWLSDNGLLGYQAQLLNCPEVTLKPALISTMLPSSTQRGMSSVTPVRRSWLKITPQDPASLISLYQILILHLY